jgi:hypothetical protein
MSGTYPASPSFNSVNFKINTPIIRTQSNSGLTRRVAQGHSFYTFTVKHNNITKYDAGPILGFVTQQYGSLEKFQIVLPEISYSKIGDQTTSTVTTSATVLAGVDNVAVTGVTSGKFLLRAGDYFKFGYATSWAASTSYTATSSKINYLNVDYVCKTTHTSSSTFDYTKWTVDNTYSKVYMCTVSWTTGTPLYFSGSLVRDIPSGTRIVYDAVPFTVILDGEVQQYDAGIGGVIQLSLDMREAW